MVDIGQNISALSTAPVVGQVRKEAPVSGNTARPAKSSSVGEEIAKANENKDSSLVNFNSNDKSLDQVAEKVQAFIPESFNNTKLSINRDETTGMFIYQSVDRKSGEVIRQFPPEDILKYIVSVRKAEGLVVDGKV